MPLRSAPAAVLFAALALSACATSDGARPNGWAAPPADRAARTDASERPPAQTVAERLPPPPHRRERLENNPPRRVRPAPLDLGVETASGLVVPVAGIAPGDLRDTFTSPRSGGRVHNAIDIAAPTGTPLLAVEDGVVTRKHWNRLGGHTLYLTSADGDTDYYYAHLDSYAAGLEIGTEVRRGDVIGAVGATGNARGPHLHFQILDKRGSGRGTPVNPYDLLQSADVASAGVESE